MWIPLFRGACRMCVCSSQRFSVCPPCSCWQHLRALDEVGAGGGSEWDGVTAVKHLSRSLPPLLFKSRHAFAHKDTHRHVGMCCATLSEHSRSRKTHTNTHKHTGVFRTVEKLLLYSSVLSCSYHSRSHLCWCGRVPSCCTVRRR